MNHAMGASISILLDAVETKKYPSLRIFISINQMSRRKIIIKKTAIQIFKKYELKHHLLLLISNSNAEGRTFANPLHRSAGLIKIKSRIAYFPSTLL